MNVSTLLEGWMTSNLPKAAHVTRALKRFLMEGGGRAAFLEVYEDGTWKVVKDDYEPKEDGFHSTVHLLSQRGFSAHAIEMIAEVAEDARRKLKMSLAVAVGANGSVEQVPFEEAPHQWGSDVETMTDCGAADNHPSLAGGGLRERYVITRNERDEVTRVIDDETGEDVHPRVLRRVRDRYRWLEQNLQQAKETLATIEKKIADTVPLAVAEEVAFGQLKAAGFDAVTKDYFNHGLEVTVHPQGLVALARLTGPLEEDGKEVAFGLSTIRDLVKNNDEEFKERLRIAVEVVLKPKEERLGVPVKVKYVMPVPEGSKCQIKEVTTTYTTVVCEV